MRDIRSLTGLRACAALLVVFYHLREVKDGLFYDFGAFDAVVRHGYLGVDLFFVLSGFIIYHVYRDSFADQVLAPAWLEFLKYRVARMYPVHLLTLTLMLGLYGVAVRLFHQVPNNVAFYTPFSLLNNLLMTHSWLPGVGAPNTPAWSISAEWFAYLLFPPVCFVFNRAPRLWSAVLVPACLAVAQLYAHEHPLLRIAPEFLLGMVLCDINRRWRLGERLGAEAGLLAGGGFLASTYVLPHEVLSIQVLLFGLLIVALSEPRDLAGRFLAMPGVTYLGEISYSIYMIHWFVWSTLKHGVPRLLPMVDTFSLPFILLSAALILAASALVYHAIEVPGRRALRVVSTTSLLRPARRQA
jgi:peptidoglycan/LPS O-acetylase OafA/YrhL